MWNETINYDFQNKLEIFYNILRKPDITVEEAIALTKKVWEELNK